MLVDRDNHLEQSPTAFTISIANMDTATTIREELDRLHEHYSQLKKRCLHSKAFVAQSRILIVESRRLIAKWPSRRGDDLVKLNELLRRRG